MEYMQNGCDGDYEEKRDKRDDGVDYQEEDNEKENKRGWDIDIKMDCE